MKRVALTGNIGAGKSLAADWLRERGLTVVDADREGHAVLKLPSVREALVLRHGEQLLQDGEIDRGRLAALVFSQPGELQALNQLVFPYLYQRMMAQLRAAQAPAAFLDAALVYEWGIEADFDEVWVVWAPDDLRLARLIESRGLSEQEARRRIESQLDQNVKRARARRTLVNNGSPTDFIRQVQDALSRLLAAEDRGID